MYDCFEYIVRTKMPDGRERKCVFTPIGKDHLFTVEIDDQGVEISSFYPEDDFNEIAVEYVERFKLGEIISRERNEGLPI